MATAPSRNERLSRTEIEDGSTGLKQTTIRSMVMRLKLIHGAMLMVVLGTIGTSQAASIRKDIHIEVPPETVWDAVADFANIHRRLVPGFVTDLKMEGNAR